MKALNQSASLAILTSYLLVIPDIINTPFIEPIFVYKKYIYKQIQWCLFKWNKNKKQKQKNIIYFFTCHGIKDWDTLSLILPCFDRSNFPIAKRKGGKIRNGPEANPGQGQDPDLEADREPGPVQDHQTDTGKGKH